MRVVVQLLVYRVDQINAIDKTRCYPVIIGRQRAAWSEHSRELNALQVFELAPIFAKRLEVSAKPRITATRNFAQLICDEQAASNGQTARENDGGMMVSTAARL
jgi:hypothetical protein